MNFPSFISCDSEKSLTTPAGRCGSDEVSFPVPSLLPLTSGSQTAASFGNLPFVKFSGIEQISVSSRKLSNFNMIRAFEYALRTLIRSADLKINRFLRVWHNVSVLD